MQSDLISIFPELVLATCAMLLLMLGVYTKTEGNKLVAASKNASFALLLGLGAILFLQKNLIHVSVFNGLVVVDSYAIFCKTIIIFAAIIVLLLSQKYLAENSAALSFEFPILLILAVVGMFVMVSAADMLTFYIGLELQSLALYVIATAKRGCKQSAEAGIKYFVLGALASGILLYGISLIYGYAGATNFKTIAFNLAGAAHLPLGVIVGLVLVLVGLSFKLSAAPFHMWAPDVYAGVPTPVTAFFAIVPKLAAIAVLTRICTTAFGHFVADWQQVIIVISVLSMLVGAFAGVWQKNIKRLLAYSAIGNIGYALVGVAAMNISSVSAVLVYFVIYILNSIGIFAIILGIKVKGNGIEQIKDFAGLAKTNPKIAIFLTLIMVSMIGLPIPPFAGFWGKFYVFEVAIAQGLYALAVIGVVSSVVAAYYYLYIIKVMYFDEPAEGVAVKLDANAITALIVITAISLVIFVQPELLTKATLLAASSLF